MVVVMFATFFGTDSADFSTIFYQVIDFFETTGKHLTGSQAYRTADLICLDAGCHMADILFMQACICTMKTSIGAFLKFDNQFVTFHGQLDGLKLKINLVMFKKVQIPFH
jgi:hypothetical protein